MSNWLESKFNSLRNSVNLVFFLLDIVTMSVVVIGLIVLSFDLDFLKYVIYSCTAVFILIVGTIILFLFVRKSELKFKTFRRTQAYSFLLIPLIIGIFLGVCIYGRQYMLALVMGIIIFGYLFGFLIAPRLNKYPVLSRLYLALVLFSIVTPFGFFARGTLPPRSASQVWVMHDIDNPGYLLSNGLDPADVNKDGFDDYLTNYEWDGMIRIEFHPGLTSVRDPWPAITVGFASNAESSGFGDFDGDGNIDVVVAHGIEAFGIFKWPVRSGVCFIWGPDPANCMDPSAWQMSKDIDGTIENGHYLYIRGLDVNGDGALDVMVGGRGLYPRAGLKWIEAPLNPADRRNVSKWQVHDIDATLESGHGFTVGDIDQDGDFDIALCNSDWDTKEEEEEILWYENPGTGTPHQRNPWHKHLLLRSTVFYSKGQVTLANLTADNYPEIITQTDNHFYIFKNPTNPQINDTWELTQVPKVPEACWFSRPTRVVDLNNDSKPDILGMLIHKNGALPPNKAAIFWMEYSGTDPTSPSANWTTHVIKWGDGHLGFIANGEKWDQVDLQDIDRDGDIDIVANCEEYHTLGFCFISVVWFENPLI